MRKLVLIAMILVSPFASTGTLKYRIHVLLARKGVPVTSATVITRSGEWALITQNDGDVHHRVHISAMDSTFNGESMIHLKLKIENLNDQGGYLVLAQPEILARENQRAEVSVGSAEGDSDLDLNVFAEHTI